jgi:hypothetical protein
VIDNDVWTDSWTSIVGAGSALICVCVSEEQTQKFYAGGPQAVERQAGLVWGTRWLTGSSVDLMVARTARRSHVRFLS